MLKQELKRVGGNVVTLQVGVDAIARIKASQHLRAEIATVQCKRFEVIIQCSVL